MCEEKIRQAADNRYDVGEERVEKQIVRIDDRRLTDLHLYPSLSHTWGVKSATICKPIDGAKPTESGKEVSNGREIYAGEQSGRLAFMEVYLRILGMFGG